MSDFSFEEDDELLQIAEKIMDAFIRDYESETNFNKMEGEVLSREQTEECFSGYIADLELEDYLVLNFIHNAVRIFVIRFIDSTNFNNSWQW